MKSSVAPVAAALLFACLQSFGQTARSLTTETTDGGPVSTKYLPGDINKDSTLHRPWHTINDSTCPIQLVKAGVKTEQQLGTQNLSYKPVVESFIAKEPITAVELRFVLFDVFDEHIVTLEVTRVEDVLNAGPFMFKRGLQDNNPAAVNLDLFSGGRSADDIVRRSSEREKALAGELAKNPSRFLAAQKEVERVYTVVSFVSQVRTKSGTIWRYDPKAIAAELAKLLRSNVGEGTLDPKTATK